MRALIFCTTLLAAPAVVMAQSHGATPDAPAKKVPTVSRVTVTPAGATTPSDSHAAPTGAGGESAHAAGGYVATGARPKAGGTTVKKKPIVSAAPTDTPPSAAHGAAASPARGGASADHAPQAPAPDAAHGASAHDGPVVSPSPVTGAAAPRASATSTGPTRLADVHGRLAAALADARPSTASASTRSHAAAEPAASPASKTPRVTLAWPKPRWQLVWPEPASADEPAAAPVVADPGPPRAPRR